MLILFIAGPMSSQGSYSSHLYHGALKLSTCDHSKGFSVQDSLCRIVSSLTITPITRHYIILVIGAFLQACRGTQVQFLNAFLRFKNVFNLSFVFYAIIMYFEYKINPNKSNKRRLFCYTVSIIFYCFGVFLPLYLCLFNNIFIMTPVLQCGMHNNTIKSTSMSL